MSSAVLVCQHKHLLEQREAGVLCRLVKLQMYSGGDGFPAGRKGCAFQEALLKKIMRAKVALRHQKLKDRENKKSLAVSCKQSGRQ